MLPKVLNSPGKTDVFSSDDVTIFGLHEGDLLARATTGITKEAVDQSLIVVVGGMFQPCGLDVPVSLAVELYGNVKGCVQLMILGHIPVKMGSTTFFDDGVIRSVDVVMC